MKNKTSRFSPASKIACLVLIAALIGFGVYAFKQAQSPVKESHDYAAAVKQSASALVPAQADGVSRSELTQLLEAGINTSQGILQSEAINVGAVEQYRLSINGKPLNIQAVSPIALVRAFVVEAKQVVLISYDQGGNQCSMLYQLITIDKHSTVISQPFGSCLAISAIIESSSQLIFKMPQNNPYLGPDVVLSYKYHGGQVLEQALPKTQQLEQKYSSLTAAKILESATADGCYVDGVLLDDNSCAGGRKYCVMFKHLANPAKDADYQTLNAFCN